MILNGCFSSSSRFTCSPLVPQGPTTSRPRPVRACLSVWPTTARLPWQPAHLLHPTNTSSFTVCRSVSALWSLFVCLFVCVWVGFIPLSSPPFRRTASAPATVSSSRRSPLTPPPQTRSTKPSWLWRQRGGARRNSWRPPVSWREPRPSSRKLRKR